MSNARKPTTGNNYRSGYLQSKAWFARRDAYFKAHQDAACAVTGKRPKHPSRELELHHVTYDGVVQRPDGSWVAGEKDTDLVPMYPACHEAVHRLLDQDRALRGLVSRQVATERAIQAVRQQLVNMFGLGPRGGRDDRDR